MTKGIIKTPKLLVVGERNCVFVFIDESNTNMSRWNVEQSGDHGGKILPAWVLWKICMSSRDVGLLEFESNERHDH